MNTEIKKYFKDLRKDLDKHKTACDNAFFEYRRGVEAATQECRKFKDEAGELETRKKALASTAKQKIKEADHALMNDLSYLHIRHLREALGDYIVERPDAHFMTALGVYKDYDLPLTRAELEGLITASGGTYISLRALQAVAGKSGFNLTVPTVADFEGDIQRLERMTRSPSYYSPTGYLHEAVELYPTQPLHRADGSMYGDGGPIRTSYLLSRNTAYNQLLTDLEDMETRWSASFVPAVTTLEDIKAENGKTVTVDEQMEQNIKDAAGQVTVSHDEAVERARERGKTKAESLNPDNPALQSHMV